jgi:hypothetical protein
MSFVLLMVATPWLEFLFIFFTLQHGYNRSKILIQEGRKFFSPAVAKENEGPKECIRLHTRYRATDCQRLESDELREEGQVGLGVSGERQTYRSIRREKRTSADGKEGPKPSADEPLISSARKFRGLSGSSEFPSAPLLI